MENPAFQDIEESLYGSNINTGVVPFNMSQRRPAYHLPPLHNPHLPPQVSLMTGPQTTQMHNSRIIGVIGTPNSSSNGNMFPNQSLPPLHHPYMAGSHHPHVIQSEPMYSCQAPSGHEHIYQCPGHRQGEDIDPRDHIGHMQHHIDLRGQSDHRGQNIDNIDKYLEHREQVDALENHLDRREHHRRSRNNNLDLRRQPLNQIEHYLEQTESIDHIASQREQHLDFREQSLDNRETRLELRDQRLDQGLESRLNPILDQQRGMMSRLDPSLDHRPEYHYGGSENSSTEPLYGHPGLYPNDIGTHTPTLSFNNIRTSLRNTGSSNLPTVSSLLAQDSSGNTAPTNTRSIQSLPRHIKGGGSVTPTKLKRQGLFRAWKVKFLRGEEERSKGCILVTALIFVLILVFGILGTVLYLTLGGGLSSFGSTSPLLIEMTETGSNVVEGEFSITNQNFISAFADQTSEPYRSIAKSIQNELDILFMGSVWSQEYNHSQVMSLSPGSLLVQVQLILNNADVAAAQKLGSAFLRGLHNRHGHEWLGPYAINITSIRFAEVLVDTPLLPTSALSAVPGRGQEDPTSTVAATRSTPHLNVGWGSWGAWSTCSPCSPQYDQIRTRQCRLDAGRGLLINTIEPCLPMGLGGQLQGSGGDMETRPCQCHQEVYDISSTTKITTESPPHIIVTTSATTTIKTTTEVIDNEQYENPTIGAKERLCDSCLPNEVCVGLQGDAYPTCRDPQDAADPTGCGGLCIMDSEVCQALGSRAFSCHSASQCLNDEWRCDDGLCIPQIKRCDGHMNCYDQSDEMQCAVSVSPSSSSVTGWKTAGISQMNPAVDVDAANPITITRVGAASQLPPFAIGGTRLTIPAMNRTAIGLSSLSHRERELLS